jgi:hypothetical protein
MTFGQSIKGIAVQGKGKLCINRASERPARCSTVSSGIWILQREFKQASWSAQRKREMYCQLQFSGRQSRQLIRCSPAPAMTTAETRGQVVRRVQHGQSSERYRAGHRDVSHDYVTHVRDISSEAKSFGRHQNRARRRGEPLSVSVTLVTAQCSVSE